MVAIAEVVSSVAIVLTLVYLIADAAVTATVQQTNTALLATSRQGTMQADVQLLTALLDSSVTELAARPFAELTETEKSQVPRFYFRVYPYSRIRMVSVPKRNLG
jgi:hypothetical protein